MTAAAVGVQLQGGTNFTKAFTGALWLWRIWSVAFMITFRQGPFRSWEDFYANSHELQICFHLGVRLIIFWRLLGHVVCFACARQSRIHLWEYPSTSGYQWFTCYRFLDQVGLISFNLYLIYWFVLKMRVSLGVQILMRSSTRNYTDAWVNMGSHLHWISTWSTGNTWGFSFWPLWSFWRTLITW